MPDPDSLSNAVCSSTFTCLRQLADAGHEVVDHSTVKQYDDFNETFWQARCLEMDVKKAFVNKNKDAFFSKTFVERQSWVHVIFIFWRV